MARYNFMAYCSECGKSTEKCSCPPSPVEAKEPEEVTPQEETSGEEVEPEEEESEEDDSEEEEETSGEEVEGEPKPLQTRKRRR